MISPTFSSTFSPAFSPTLSACAMANPPSNSNVTTTDDAPFTIMKLAPELRLIVYHYYFEDVRSNSETSATCHGMTKNWEAGLPSCIPKVNTPISTLSPYLNLLHSSIKVRGEAAPVFYKDYVGDADLSFTIGSRDGDYANTPTRMASLKAFCTSLAIYNPNMNFVYRLGDTAFFTRPYMAVRLYLKALQFHARIGGYAMMAKGSTIALLRNPYEKKNFERAMDGMSRVAGFEFGYELDTHELWAEVPTTGALVIYGPIAKIDWSGFQLAASVYDHLY